MRLSTPGLACAALALLLAACGGGGGGGSNPPPLGGNNTPPTASAGANQTVSAGVTVTLNGSQSSDTDGTVATYAWTQTGGTPVVTLSSASVAQPTFPAPQVIAATAFTFSLVVTDNDGSASTASTVTITVNPQVAGQVNVTGTVTFARVPFSTTGARGLNYGAAVQRPARAVLVRALAAGTANELARTSTGTDGSFSLSVASNTNVSLEVQAVMLRDAAQALPRWNVRVQDGTAGNDPYSYSDGASFNSSTTGARTLAIPSGINASGVATGARSSGPFAILDTIYQAMQTVVGAAPDSTFPPFIVDWGSQTEGTFFSGGTPQHIALLADLTEDTDEFDQHVIAHEFGHYVEHNFSRADNIGGSHALGQRLDPRVAFGEGWGYAFAAIALNDVNARDSFFGDITPNDGVDNPVHASGGFDIERNPATPATQGDGVGCWCSESSVWSILYDLHDNAADANDNVALGFTPIWNVLVGAQADTPALTTIFPFITALKNAGTGQNAQIDALVGAQNITLTGMNAFAATETHEPLPGRTVLPMFTTIARGQTVMLPTTDDGGRYNRAGNHRFLRFDSGSSSAPFTVSLSSSNPNTADPDFIVYQEGLQVLSGESPPNGGAQTGTLDNVIPNSTYIIDVYDCANGCRDEEGVAGDYTLTVTLN